MARSRHISGTVVCLLVISAAGIPTRIEPLSGADILRPAAVNAVKQYRYKPYLRDGQPTAVQTTITVNFAP